MPVACVSAWFHLSGNYSIKKIGQQDEGGILLTG